MPACRPLANTSTTDLSTNTRSLRDSSAGKVNGPASTLYTGQLQTVTYHVPRYRFRACRAFTNKPPCGPKRGHGTPQPRFAQEVQLDKIADEPVQLSVNRKLVARGEVVVVVNRFGIKITELVTSATKS